MPPVNTRPCTVVYTECPEPDHTPEFREREIPRVDQFVQKPVKINTYLPKHEVVALLGRLVQQNTRAVRSQGSMTASSADSTRSGVRLSRCEKVNRKRRLIASCISNQKILNLKQIAKHTKSCYHTVKRVYQDLRDGVVPDTYQYNNLRPADELDKLDTDIKMADGGLMSVADLKRLNPTFSRKKILETLHMHDLRWRKLPLAEPKNLWFPPPNKNHVNQVISQLARVHDDPKSVMLFIDEMKFPLIQTAKYHWIRRDATSDIKLNRRDVDNETLTAIAMCSTQQFVAVQLFRGEIKGVDFLNFLNQSIASLPADKNYLILADNATWHNSALVKSTKAYQFLHFNVPRMFQLNLIENAFSAVRAEFRRRPLVKQLEAEAGAIVRIFLSPDNPKRFCGYLRNHFRMLLKYFK